MAFETPTTTIERLEALLAEMPASTPYYASAQVCLADAQWAQEAYRPDVAQKRARKGITYLVGSEMIERAEDALAEACR